ncbi:MAG: GNAT family N-acetyltransferase [Vulcanimicrobiaceae bacterium]
MTEPPCVREATLADVDGIIDALGPVAAEDRWIATELPLPRERMRVRFAQTLESTEGTIFVALQGTQIVGSLGLHGGYRGAVELGMSLVAECRGRGLGSRLMEAAVAWSRAHGYHKISLTVAPWNEAAIRLYERYGFVREGFLRKHLRRNDGALWDLIEMGLLLDEAPLR